MNSSKQNDRYEGYISVAERIEKFYTKYPSGRILTQIVEHDRETGFILMRAQVYRSPDDAEPSATGHAYEIKGEGFVNRASHIENCETGAVGRALANLGLGVKRGIASREEMEKVERMSRPMTQLKEVKMPPALESLSPEDQHTELDHMIVVVADDLGHDAEWLKMMIEKRFQVSDGLNSLSLPYKKQVLDGLLKKRASMEQATA